MTVWRLNDGLSGRPGAGPSSAAASSGNFLAGLCFQVSQGGLWLLGYDWWVCNTGQQTSAVDHALWQITGATAGTFIPGSHVTSGTLTAGQYNTTLLPTPIGLSLNTPYVAQVGFVDTLGFPLTQNQFGAGNPYVSGITNGPLSAPGAGNAEFDSFPQGGFSSTNGADPTAGLADSAFNNSNFWIFPVVTDQAPLGASFRLWPNQPVPLAWQLDTPTANWTLATEFTLSQTCKLNKIWFYSPPGVTQLPTETGIFLNSNQSIVSGTHNVSPSWSGAAGSGWVSVSYSNVVLPAGDYKVAVCNGAGSVANWSATTFPYWGDSGHPVGQGVNGITNGPIAAPNNANATAPGQSTYQPSSTLTWTNTYAPSVGSATYWVDAEVTPTSAGGLLLMNFP